MVLTGRKTTARKCKTNFKHKRQLADRKKMTFNQLKRTTKRHKRCFTNYKKPLT